MSQRLDYIFRSYLQPRNVLELEKILDTMGIFEGGFTINDLNYLKVLKEIGGQASVDTLKNVSKLDDYTIRKEVEPFLLEKGKITITSRGRKLCQMEN
jgi:Holliday junction resolvasome RuvABC ATP-dependent DNA helicase subunit